MNHKPNRPRPRVALLSSLLFPAVGLLSLGCTPDDASEDEDGGDATETGDFDPETLYECQDGGFMEFRPLIGPGYDPSQGGLVGELQDEYVVHTTQIYVKPEEMENFLATSQQVTDQLDATPGLLGYGLGGDTKCGVTRTLGLWESEEAMYAFVTSGAHVQAMGQATELSYTGRVTHWTATPQEVAELDWDVARAQVDGVPTSGLY